jgi:hypothetical protein
MPTKSMSTAEAEEQLQRARGQLSVLEGRLRSGHATLEEHIAAKQFVHFAEDVLKNVRERVADEERQQAERARIEKARRDHAAAVRVHLEGLSAVVDAIAASQRADDNLIAATEDYNRDALKLDHSVDWRALQEINPVVGIGRGSRLSVPEIIRSKVARVLRKVDPQHYGPFEVQFGKPFDLDQIQRLRDSIAGQEEKQPAASTNGSHTKKGTK